jgi:hypothetical protein
MNAPPAMRGVPVLFGAFPTNRCGAAVLPAGGAPEVVGAIPEAIPAKRPRGSGAARPLMSGAASMARGSPPPMALPIANESRESSAASG